MGIELTMTQAEAIEYMRKTAASFGYHNLAHGVGNDMSCPFYTNIHDGLIQFWPQGNDGSLVLIWIKPYPTKEIQVAYHAVDGYRETRYFKTWKGAQRYAQRMIGVHPEILSDHYAISGDGISKIASNVPLTKLFPDSEPDNLDSEDNERGTSTANLSDFNNTGAI